MLLYRQSCTHDAAHDRDDRDPSTVIPEHRHRDWLIGGRWRTGESSALVHFGVRDRYVPGRWATAWLLFGYSVLTIVSIVIKLILGLATGRRDGHGRTAQGLEHDRRRNAVCSARSR